MIIIGITLFFSSLILFTLVDIYWFNISYYVFHATSIEGSNLVLIGCLTIGILNSIATIFIIIGGRQVKIGIDYWLVLIGTILVMNSPSFGCLSIMIEIRKVYINTLSERVYLDTLSEIIFKIWLISIGIGIFCVFVGGLMKSRKQVVNLLNSKKNELVV